MQASTVFIYKHTLNVKIHVHIYFAVISNVSYTFGYIKKPLVCVEFEYNRNAQEKGFHNRRQVGNNLKERQSKYKLKQMHLLKRTLHQ